jgi:hypothetical protein
MSSLRSTPFNPVLAVDIGWLLLWLGGNNLTPHHRPPPLHLPLLLSFVLFGYPPRFMHSNSILWIWTHIGEYWNSIWEGASRLSNSFRTRRVRSQDQGLPASTFCLSPSSSNSNSHKFSCTSLIINFPAGLHICIRMALKAFLLSFFGTPNRPTRHLEPLVRRSWTASSAISIPYCSPTDKGNPPNMSYFLSAIISLLDESKCQKKRQHHKNSNSGTRKETMLYSNKLIIWCSIVVHMTYILWFDYIQYSINYNKFNLQNP